MRCQWAVDHPELVEFHDKVWGRPTHDDQAIFAANAQCVLHAGLLWTAMLKKRPVFAEAFDNWDVAKIAKYDGVEVERLMHTEGMMRNLQKISCIITNAKRYLEVQAEFGSFAEYIWRFTDGEPLIQDESEKVGRREAEILSDDMKKRGFKFAGPASMYGLMEDIGMVNDHNHYCFCYQDIVG